MKVPNVISTYCPYCRKHTEHKVSTYSPGKRRSLAFGNVKFENKLRGHGGKRAGKKSVKKQGKRQVVVLTCTECNKKQMRVYVKSRTKKKIEVKR
ncbi:MAG: 50S ribosomal protein L44e [Candidatus Micrarchaeota archaeon]|nr:50S ribosomal protein L44e [Candidatus Micrarchaeota archaeon]